MTDKEKFNKVFLQLKSFEIPDFEDELYQQLAQEIKEGLEIILNGIKKGAENIKNLKE